MTEIAFGIGIKTIPSDPGGAVAPPADDPNSIFGSSLEFWYDSIKQGGAAGPVVTLTDFSAKMNNAVVFGAETPANIQLNGTDSLAEWDFDGASHAYQIATGLSFLEATDWHIWAVVNANTPRGLDSCIVGRDAGVTSDTNVLRIDTSDNLEVATAGNIGLIVNPYPKDNLYASLHHEHLSTTVNSVFIDSVLVGAQPMTAGTRSVRSIGCSQNNNNFQVWNGQVRMVAMVRGAVTVQQVTDMDLFCAGRLP